MSMKYRKYITLVAAFCAATCSVYVLMYNQIRFHLFGGAFGFKEPQRVYRRLRTTLENSEFPVETSRNDRYNWGQSTDFSDKYWRFSPSLNATEYKWYMTLIQAFKNVCESNGISYMLYSGSAIGAYRHHGFIPWDDDFDVLTNASQRQLLNHTLSSVPGYGLVAYEHYQWKFYSRTFGKPSKSCTCNWPFVDIYFFDYNETHVYDVTYPFKRDFYPRSVQLPIQNGIFENLIMPVPNDLDSYLKTNRACKSNHFDHRNEWYRKTDEVPCETFYNVYTFVFRSKIGDDHFEELRLGNKTLYRVRKPSSKVL